MFIEVYRTVRGCIPKTVKRRLRFLATYPKYWLQLRRNYAYDRRRFGKYSSANSSLKRRIQLQAWIIGDYHKIEKALALRSPRPGFGAAVVHRLIENLERYSNDCGIDEICIIAINALREYLKFNAQNGFEDLTLNRKIDQLSSLPEYDDYNLGQGGTIQVNKDEILKQGCLDLEAFFESRHSIRQFSDEPVPEELVSKAVRMARRTPSVCNRQSWKVYAYADPVLLEQVVECQKGNRGFGDQIKTMLVVTSNTETFFSIGERNQCWIDGGMFSMSLVYALHSLGLGSICLNWSVEKATDENLHQVASIPDFEAVIMMIGIGFLPETFRVAQSHRKPLEELLIWDRKR